MPLDADYLNINDDTPEKHAQRTEKARGEGVELPCMRPGWYMSEGEKVEQSFYFNDGRRKGMKTILEERGIHPPNGSKWTRE